MRSHFNVHCMMCGRASGYIHNGTFYRLPTAPPLVVRNGRSRCGFCAGNVYLEPEDSPVLSESPDGAVHERRIGRAS